MSEFVCDTYPAKCINTNNIITFSMSESESDSDDSGSEITGRPRAGSSFIMV